MGENSDLIKLYSGRILALAADIPHTDPLENPDGEAMRRSPQCGSKVCVALKLGPEGRISDYAQDVKACALGQASAALSGANMIGRNKAEVLEAQIALADMLEGKGQGPEAPFSGYEVLTPAIEYKNRHASILLALNATLDAFEAVT